MPFCHPEPFLAHLLLCPLDIGSPHLPSWVRHKKRSYVTHQRLVVISSNIGAPESFILAPAIEDTHTKYFFSEWKAPDSG